MAVDFFNPFSGIREAKHTPHARALRTSLRQKVKDTYFIFAGNENHVGIYDYVSLFIPRLFENVLPWRGAVFFYALRAIVSGAATALFFPIVLIVHSVAALIAANYKKRAMELRGYEIDSRHENGQMHNLSCAEFLAKNQLDVEDIQVTVEALDPQLKPTLIHTSHQLKFWRHAPGKKKEEGTGFVIPLQQAQKVGLFSFFQLNIGAVVSNIEKCNEVKETAINNELLSQYTG
ncbi:hypothetical protein Lbir_2434 [Legionella birminghamensis]|uniref:Uncharacterized protein n=1 Tax=Legionella birminghamensis TaxID=28083 RepID=A0A378ID52_9GAMM|nr:hypothetical protein [Legionella birminghamensis]KTC68901.1 hypothetical protein Lbir_2434 [Legionella birminghamensis]STX33157.1 Uncharacterised protein [Legionella birminghamensis]